MARAWSPAPPHPPEATTHHTPASEGRNRPDHRGLGLATRPRLYTRRRGLATRPRLYTRRRGLNSGLGQTQRPRPDPANSAKNPPQVGEFSARTVAAGPLRSVGNSPPQVGVFSERPRSDPAASARPRGLGQTPRPRPDPADSAHHTPAQRGTQSAWPGEPVPNQASPCLTRRARA